MGLGGHLLACDRTDRATERLCGTGRAAGFALRPSHKRQFDAGDAGLLDDAEADDMLPADFELSAAGVLAEAESVFDD
jgi:hypothetical protein